MAKASSKTTVYEIRSRATGHDVTVTERALFKTQNVAGLMVRTELRPQITDRLGRSYERLSGMLMRCVQSGEVFNIIEQAPSIRKVSA
jgi:hypothetical protein